jgi:hypothetical protein
MFQVSDAIVHVGRFAAAVVLAADDQQVLSVAQRLQPDIMIGLQRVPDQHVLDRPTRHGAGDHIGAHRFLLGVNYELVVDRRVGRENRGFRADAGAGFGVDGDAAGILAVFDVYRAAVNPAATRFDSADQSANIFQRM